MLFPLILGYSLVLVFSYPTSLVQASSPITSSGLNTQVSAPLPLASGQTQYNITGGTRPGGGVNLFHSFGNFNVPTNNIANFLNSGSIDLNGTLLLPNLPTANILGRINGGNPSSIFGMIQTNGPGGFPNANLFLMNPNGFLFGPTATINVGGMVTFTTADYMRLTDSTRFNAVAGPADALLTVAPVAAFGFLGNNPAAIAVQGSTLQVAQGQSLALVGGNQGFTATNPDTGNPIPVPGGITMTGGKLSAPGGQINLASVASACEVSAVDFMPTAGMAMGNISLSQGALLDVSANAASVAAGTVRIRGGQFVMDDSRITATTIDEPGGSIDVNVQTANLTNGAQITADTHGTGPAGSITANVGTLTMTNAHISSSSTLVGPTAGSAGTITIQGVKGRGSPATSVSLDNSTMFTLIPGGSASPTPATIDITAQTVNLTNAAISSNTGSDTPAGNITLNVGQLTMTGNSEISSASLRNIAAAGNAGTITIQGLHGPGSAATSVSLDNSAISTTNNGGSATNTPASITVTANTVSLLSEAPVLLVTGIFADTSGAGPAGNITLNVGTLTALPAKTNPFFHPIISSTSTPITSPTPGSAGTITIQGINGPGSAATSVSLDHSTLSTTISSGSASTTPATIGITAQTVNLTNGGQIKADTSGAAPAGNITFNVGTLTAGTSTISSTTTLVDPTAGNAGTISIQGVHGPGTSAESVTISGVNSSISSSTAGSGKGGAIQIQAHQVEMEQSAALSAQTSGTGNAGDITVTADSLNILSGARISTSTTGAGNGGTITVNTTGDVTLQGTASADFTVSEGIGFVRSGLFAKTQTVGTGTGGGGGGGGGGQGGTGKAGNAGDIVVRAKNVTLTDGAQIDNSTQSAGVGGKVSVTATDTITVAGAGSSISSDSTRGTGSGGNIHLQAGQIEVRDGGAVSASTFGVGNAGSIDLNVMGTLQVTKGGSVSTTTSGDGNGGTITVQADQVLMDGTGSRISADTRHPFADLKVALDLLHKPDSDLIVFLDSPSGQRIAMFSQVGGNGSNFTGTVLNDQAAKPITQGAAPFTGSFQPRQPLSQLVGTPESGTWTLNIRDTAGGSGTAGLLQNWSLQFGNQVFRSTDLPKNILVNGTIQSSIPVNAGSLLINGVGNSKGNGGDITLNVRSLSLQNGATISATTQGSGNGGILTVNATGPVTLTGSNSGLFTNAEANGAGGDINIAAGQSVALTNGASISASSTGAGNAGSIHINAGQSFTATNSKVTTEANQASGGTIEITTNPNGGVQLINSTISASVLDGTGGGGSVSIDPQFVLLQNSQILANAVQGPGGNIFITTNLLLPDATSVISASSQFGQNGTITVQSPIAPASRIISLSQKPLIATSLLNLHCAKLAQGNFSSFTLAGRDSLPAEPSGWLSSPLALVIPELVGSTASEPETQTSLSESTEEMPILSLRRIAPPGFLTQTFAVDGSGCTS